MNYSNELTDSIHSVKQKQTNELMNQPTRTNELTNDLTN